MAHLWTSAGSEGNRETALVHSSEYFPLLYRTLCDTKVGDCNYLADFRSDADLVTASAAVLRSTGVVQRPRLSRSAASAR